LRGREQRGYAPTSMGAPVVPPSRRTAQILRRLALLDAVFVVAAFVGFLLLRFKGDVPPPYWPRTILFALLAAVAHGVAGRLAGPRPLPAAGLALLVGVLLVAVALVLRQATRVPPLSVIALASLATVVWFGVTRLIASRSTESAA
jgi:hypothetical protein